MIIGIIVSYLQKRSNVLISFKQILKLSEFSINSKINAKLVNGKYSTIFKKLLVSDLCGKNFRLFSLFLDFHSNSAEFSGKTHFSH